MGSNKQAAEKAIRVPLALLAASLALRPPLTALGPLIPRIQKDLAISHTVAGLVPGSVLLFMGLSSLLAPRFVRRVGWFVVCVVALIFAGATGVARAIVPSGAALVLLSMPIGIGAGIAGTALPTAVTDLYPDKRATGAAINALGINIGAAGAAALAIPIADTLGGWRASLLCFSLVCLGCALVWTGGTRAVPPQTRPPHLALPLRDHRAWSLTGLFALQGLCFYGFGAWLPDAYVEHHWTQSAAGGLVAVVNAAAVPASFLIPHLSDRLGTRLLPLALSALGLLAGSLALTVEPDLGWVAAIMVGISLGGLFSLCLLLSIDLGRQTRAVEAFAGMMFGLGYTISAGAPVVLGLVRDLAGSFSTALWLIVAIAAAILLLLVVGHQSFEPEANPTELPSVES